MLHVPPISSSLIVQAIFENSTPCFFPPKLCPAIGYTDRHGFPQSFSLLCAIHFTSTPNIRRYQSKSLTASLNKRRIKKNLQKSGCDAVWSWTWAVIRRLQATKRHGVTVRTRSLNMKKPQQQLQLILRLQKGKKAGYVLINARLRRHSIIIATAEEQ